MSTSIHPRHSSRAAGAAQARLSAADAPQERRGSAGNPGLATLLLSALVASVMVVADQAMDSVSDAHLLVLWMVLWASAFVALVLFSGLARTAAERMKAGPVRPMRTLRRADVGVRNDRQVAAGLAASDDETYREVVRPQLKTMNPRAKRLARFS
jgi:hypothetical protein